MQSGFNAARPEGRESDARYPVGAPRRPIASMLPAPKGGSRCSPRSGSGKRSWLQCCPPRRAGVGPTDPRALRRRNVLQCCPPRRAGVGNNDPSNGQPLCALQCCPPRRAGVGHRRIQHGCRPRCFNAARPEGRESASSRWVIIGRPSRFNAARPEGRESGAVLVMLRRLTSPASMLPAPKGGSRPPYRVGRCIDRYRASMLPAPKGGSRRRVTRHSGHRSRRFNAARPEGRESGPRHHRW